MSLGIACRKVKEPLAHKRRPSLIRNSATRKLYSMYLTSMKQHENQSCEFSNSSLFFVRPSVNERERKMQKIKRERVKLPLRSRRNHGKPDKLANHLRGIPRGAFRRGLVRRKRIRSGDRRELGGRNCAKRRSERVPLVVGSKRESTRRCERWRRYRTPERRQKPRFVPMRCAKISFA